MVFYLVKSDDIKFRYFFTDYTKAKILYDILKERYTDIKLEFKTLEMSDKVGLNVILDEILLKEFSNEE